MNLQNPLQIAAILGREPLEVNRIIRKNGIPAHTHKDGKRAGLYDLEEVRSAMQMEAQREADRLDALKQS